MKQFIKPNWEQCNLNISATLADFLGCPNNIPTLPLLREELKKGYKNVVFICFDGLGIHPINVNLEPEDFLRKNIKQVLTSTFPSTTTNATTSLMNNQYPLEHGWFGWSLYYENLNRNINIFLGTDNFSNEKVDVTNSPLGKLDYYFNNAKSEYKINSIFPPYVKVQKEENNNSFSDTDEFFEIIQDVCNQPEKQFIYAYFPDPDSTMHNYGVSSKEAHYIINTINNKVKKLYHNTKDTLFIISADHGQVDIDGYIELYQDTKLYDMLNIYPYMEPRAIAFSVKDGKNNQFEEYFNSNYKDNYVLYKSQELIDQNYFGPTGDKSHLLGDYIAISYTNKQALLTPNSPKFKGHHTSLTEEMEVPLIIIKN